jgi:hypothetical protein
VKSVSVSSNKVEVVGIERLVVQVVRRATLIASAADLFRNPVRDPYKPDPEVTLTTQEEIERSIEADDLEGIDPTHGRLADLKGMVSIPWHFNTNFISDKVSISGEVLIRQSGVKVETKIEDFRVERITIGMDAGVVVNLVIECNEKEDTSDDEPDTKEKTLFTIDQIPVFTFSLGGVPVSVKPVFALTAGVEANIPTSLTLPLQSSFTMGMEMGYDRAQEQATGDGFFYRPILDFVPVRVSDPTVFDELAATLSLWTQLDMKLLIEAGSGITIDSGPSVGIRLQNDYRLAPFSNPWWEVDLGLDLIGKFDVNLDLAGLENVQLVDTSASLHHWDLFHADAGGPLIGGGTGAPAAPARRPEGGKLAGVPQASPGTGGAAGSKPRVGENVRWARQFHPLPHLAGIEDGFVLPVPGSDGEVIAGGHGPSSAMARFTRTGDLVWMKNTFPWLTMQAASAAPGGTYFTAGLASLDVVGSLYDGNGERLWSTALLPSPLFTVAAAGAHTNAAGQAEYFIAGYIHHGTVRTSDPALIKLGPDGAVLWARYYANPGDDEVRGMTMTSDGHVVLSGFVEEAVAPPPYGTPTTGRAGGVPNALAGGLLMKIDGQTGEILWATVCPARWSMVLHEVVEGPGGVLFAAGAARKTVVILRPSNLVARFSPDGALEAHVTVGSDPEWPSSLVGGRTPYDQVRGLKWTQEGLVACGESGLGVGHQRLGHGPDRVPRRPVLLRLRRRRLQSLLRRGGLRRRPRGGRQRLVPLPRRLEHQPVPPLARQTAPRRHPPILRGKPVPQSLPPALDPSQLRQPRIPDPVVDTLSQPPGGRTPGRGLLRQYPRSRRARGQPPDLGTPANPRRPRRGHQRHPLRPGTRGLRERRGWRRRKRLHHQRLAGFRSLGRQPGSPARFRAHHRHRRGRLGGRTGGLLRTQSQDPGNLARVRPGGFTPRNRRVLHPVLQPFRVGPHLDPDARKLGRPENLASRHRRRGIGLDDRPGHRSSHSVPANPASPRLPLLPNPRPRGDPDGQPRTPVSLEAADGGLRSVAAAWA